MPADFGRVYDAFEHSYDEGQRRSEHKRELAFRMARAKKEDEFHQATQDQHDRQQDLQGAEHGVDPYTQFNASEADSRSQADSALGPGTADAMGMGRPPAGSMQPGMSDLAGRMAGKQKADTDYRVAEAEWLRRRNPGGAGGGRATSQQLAAAKALIAGMDKKVAMGDPLSDTEQENYDAAKEVMGRIAGTEYTPPTDAERAPKPKKPGWGDFFSKMLGSGGAPPSEAAPTASVASSGGIGGAFDKMIGIAGAPPPPKKADTGQLYLQYRAQGLSPADAKRKAQGQ